MKISFPKCVKRHSKKWACNAHAKFKDCVLVKSFSHICTYLWRALFQNMISEIGTDIATLIFGLACNTFRKCALHIYAYLEGREQAGTLASRRTSKQAHEQAGAQTSRPSSKQAHKQAGAQANRCTSKQARLAPDVSRHDVSRQVNVKVFMHNGRETKSQTPVFEQFCLFVCCCTS